LIRSRPNDLVDHNLPPTASDILLYQTASGTVYEQMLAATAGCHSAYARANRLDFRTFIGVRRGFHAWQATFNRIEMLHDLLNKGFRGWFVYFDADAVVVQPGFDLRRYLGKRSAAALIAAPGGPEHWNINAGIFFLNLGNALGRELAARWHRATHEQIDEALLQASIEPWQVLPDGRDFPDDQHLLQMEIRNDPELDAALLREEDGLINYGGGRFIRQFLRLSGAPEERLAHIRRMVELSAGSPAK